MAVVPGKTRLRHLGRPVHPLGLKPGGRIREVLLSIEPVKIVAARFHAGNHGGEVTPSPYLQGQELLSGGDEMHLHPLRQWRPHQETAVSISQISSPQADVCHHQSPVWPRDFASRSEFNDQAAGAPAGGYLTLQDGRAKNG